MTAQTVIRSRYRQIMRQGTARVIGGKFRGPVAKAGSPLTCREIEVAGLLVEGLTNDEIAVACDISPSTTKFHVINVITKLAARNRTHAACLWLRSTFSASIAPSVPVAGAAELARAPGGAPT